MSQSEEEARQELEDSINLGRCKMCDGMKCVGYPESCTCCFQCGNPTKSLCLCCSDCDNLFTLCTCSGRIAKIWDKSHYCRFCPSEGNSRIVHNVGVPCPLCCPYCKKHKDQCSCCDRCHKTPCICCTRCGDLRIHCKCMSANVLLHFIRRAVQYHPMQRKLRESYFPVNTAALITVKSDE
jgi:hypothetical protein